MSDRGDRLSLLSGGRTEQSARCYKEDAAQPSRLQIAQYFRAEHRGAAAAARAAGVDVLSLAVKNHQSAIAVLFTYIDPCPPEQLIQYFAADRAKITREYHIIIIR